MAYVGKIVLEGEDARTKLAAGRKLLRKTVGRTLGPYGVNAVTEKKLRITNDGYNIASELTLNDEIEDLGLRISREACNKTNEIAGDGTTTTVVLHDAISDELESRMGGKDGVIGNRIPTASLVKQVHDECAIVVEALKEQAQEISSEEELVNSAVVSVEDQELGELIGKTQWELGKDGVIIAEETTNRVCSVEKIQGIRTDNGFATSLIVNNEEKQELMLQDTLVLLTNYNITDLKPFEGILEQIVAGAKSGSFKTNNLVIIASAFTDEAVQICMQNIRNEALKIYPISAPFLDQTQVMKDIESVVGGRFINYEDSMLKDTQIVDFGFASKVIARRFETIITGREDETVSERVEKRIQDLQEKLEGSESEFEKTNIRSRLAQLTSGFALLKIGANSEVERKRLKDKADDAVNAVKAAFQEGTVPGAGLAYKTASESLPDGSILKRALAAPYEQIMSTAPSDFVVEDWVRDPLLVMRVALENACSVSGDLATASIAIATERDRGCAHNGKASGPSGV